MDAFPKMGEAPKCLLRRHRYHIGRGCQGGPIYPETQLIDALIAFGRAEGKGRVSAISLDLAKPMATDQCWTAATLEREGGWNSRKKGRYLPPLSLDKDNGGKRTGVKGTPRAPVPLKSVLAGPENGSRSPLP